MVLINVHQDKSGKWPEEFHEKMIKLMDTNTKRIYNTTLIVKKIDKETFIADITKERSHYEYIAVYAEDFDNLHTVYVESYDQDSAKLHFLNSVGDSNNWPCLGIEEVHHVYRVKFRVEDEQLYPIFSDNPKPQSMFERKRRPRQKRIKTLLNHKITEYFLKSSFNETKPLQDQPPAPAPTRRRFPQMSESSRAPTSRAGPGF